VPGATKEEFYRTLDGAPYAARAFFEAVEAQFANRNSVFVHFTNTNGGDLRLATPNVIARNGKPRNFATMYWQPKKSIVQSRMFLSPEELCQLGFDYATMPKRSTEPLRAELRLTEDFWREKSADFGRFLEVAHVKMLAQA
jgi:hypothetical protein